MVDLQGQYEELKAEIDSSFREILATTQFVNGPQVNQFTSELEKYLNVEHVIPCANGTDALQIALMALGLKPGDEVITTPFTFVSTAEMIAILGLKPVFVDIEADTFNIDPKSILEKIGPKTRAIIPVHLFGQSADMNPIMQIADEHKIAVIEDNAQAIGANYTFLDGTQKMAGTIGHIGTTSFFPSKNLGCYGDGGAITTNDAELAHKMKTIANHGSAKRYYHDMVGVNSRLDTLQAAVLLAKLPKLNDYNSKRVEAADLYDKFFKGVDGLTVPLRAENRNHVFHQYTLKIHANRDQVKTALDEAGIPNGIYYPVPMHLQKAYRSYGYQKGDLPISEEMSEKVLSLPMHTCLTYEQQEFIVKKLLNALSRATQS